MSFQYFWWWYEIEILTFKKKERLGLKGRGLTGDLGFTIYGIETFTLCTKIWAHWYDHFERTTLEWLHWNDHIEMTRLKWPYWNDFIGMTTLKWLHWNDHIEMTNLKWPHWNDHIEMTTVAAAFTQCSSIYPMQQHFPSAAAFSILQNYTATAVFCHLQQQQQHFYPQLYFF